MTHYYFDPEEKEYIEVKRRYPFIPGPKGEPPLSPVEIYKRKRAEFARQQERAAKEKAAEKEMEQAAKEALEKALKGVEKELNK